MVKDSLVGPEPSWGRESFWVLCILNPVESTPFVTQTAQEPPFLLMFLWEPEYVRQACISGDRMGSGMERPGFRSSLSQSVAA